MPTIKIEKVISFSSEDSICVASNILSSDSSKKWKCQLGEKSASLVLQLEKATVISNIDIGNENSAYIEVLVSRSGASDNFKVLLVMSSFMTPLEARQSTNINKVRMFSHDQLSKPERDEKWDRVKVVCTQPFNRHVQYGLSFINFHSPGEQIESSINSHIGKFALRPNSPDELSKGSLFARRKQLQENTPLKAAAAIREASSACLSTGTKSPANQKKFKLSSATPNKQIVVNNGTATPRNRHELLYTKDEDEPNKKIDEIVEKKAEERTKKEADEENKLSGNNSLKNKQVANKTTSIKLKDVPSNEKCAQGTKAGPSKDKREPGKRKMKESKETPSKKLKISPSKPFEQLLGGVVLVISGIQNPDRANIRSKALAMGAKYKADWDNTCTHLICAFSNTPKFNQVKGKGKIVKAQWINDCHSKRKRLPWRRYALDKKDQGKDESEEEISEEIKTTSKTTVPHDEVKNGKRDTISDDDIKIIEPLRNEICIDVSDSENTENLVQNHNESGTDTEDEIERIQALQRKKDTNGQSDIYNVETDEEDIGRTNCLDQGIILPDFFSNKTFYLDSNFNNDEKSLLLKYIVAFKGVLTEDLDDKVDIVISSKEWKFNNKNAVPLMNVVSPDFVWECHNCQKLLPVDDFKI